MTPLHAARLQGEALFAASMPRAYHAALRLRGRSNPMKVLLAGLTRRGDVAFDVGANRGLFTALMSNIAGPGGRVHAFEPSPATSGLLRATLAVRARTPENVIVNVVATGAGDGAATLHTPQRDHGQASLKTHETGSWAGVTAVQHTEVALIRLDSYVAAQRITRVDVVKMDIEGAELPAIRGFAGGLRAFHPVVVCELCAAWTRAFGYEPGAVIAELARSGYTAFHVVTPRGDLTPLGDPAALDDGESRDIVASTGAHARRVRRLVR
ncbi:MAG TPA: FkbM family methyltransferase [Gemmatimonadaceae bacterium]|nr:FkbM family methyltransferase [Gemmatimonadaceae bacterium]